MKRTCFFLFSILLFVISCKQGAEVSPALNEALAIQDEAIHIGMSVDSVLNARMSEGQYAQDIEKLQHWKTFVQTWKANMVAVPGVVHDHDHHDHAGHDHEGHDHGDAKAAEMTHLTPEEIKKVQEEWKAAIVAIRDSLK